MFPKLGNKSRCLVQTKQQNELNFFMNFHPIPRQGISKPIRYY
jgi:hypothetical protein